NDEDWFHVTGFTGDTTVCVSFTHADGDIDIAAYDGVDTGASVPVGDGAPVSESATKTNLERVVVPLARSAMPDRTEYWLRVHLDPRDHVDTTYDLTILDGDVACP